MKLALGVICAVLGVEIALMLLTWVIQGDDFLLYSYWAPKQEAVRREVFEQTKSYNQGMIQELQNMQFEYIKADPSHQKALRSIILHRAADFDSNKRFIESHFALPEDLHSFIEQLKRDMSFTPKLVKEI